MPLLKAQRYKELKRKPEGNYKFNESQKKQWEAFWEHQDGDMDKILAFAEKGDVSNPAGWYEALHLFLFGALSGNPKLTKMAARNKFGDFLVQVIENHMAEPKQRWWYGQKGTNQRNFLAMLERASDIPDEDGAVTYMNAHIPDFGMDIYSEFLLTKTKEKANIKSIASDMNEKAYRIEQEAGFDILDRIAVGAHVEHYDFPNEEFRVTDVDVGNELITVEDQKGIVGYIRDPWNIQ